MPGKGLPHQGLSHAAMGLNRAGHRATANMGPQPTWGHSHPGHRQETGDGLEMGPSSLAEPGWGAQLKLKCVPLAKAGVVTRVTVSQLCLVELLG